MDNKLVAWLSIVSIFFIAGGAALIITGHDVTAYMGLLPVMASQLLLLTRVHKVEKNTNGNMSKLIDAALTAQNPNKENTPNGNNTP